MSAAPDASVVIPTRDRWHYLQGAIRSALGQVGISVEVIVVDDDSGDGTSARLAQITDERLRVVRTGTRLGVAAARNEGLAQARGEWLAFLDDDDLWSPDKLRAQLSAARGRAADLAYSAAIYVDDRLVPRELVPAPAEDRLLANLLQANVMPAGSSNVVARTELLRELDGFDERLAQIADWDLWIRLACAGRPAAVHEPLVAYRMHAGNMVLGREREATQELEHLAAKHAGLARREGVEIDRVGYSRWLAWARRRDGRRLAAAATYLRGAVRYRSPGNVIRAGGALAGERAMRLLGSHPTAPPPAAGPAWLDDYR